MIRAEAAQHMMARRNDSEKSDASAIAPIIKGMSREDIPMAKETIEAEEAVRCGNLAQPISIKSAAFAPCKKPAAASSGMIAGPPASSPAAIHAAEARVNQT